MINAKKPHFLEIFLPNLSSQRLEVPSKFTKHLRGRTSGALLLTGPSGNSWHVDLIDHNGHLFFDGGWPTFVKDHSIQCGDSLVFRYDGKSHFTVQIFDESSCEKDEALNAKCSQGSTKASRNLGKKRGRDNEASFRNDVGDKKRQGTLISSHLDLAAGGYREKDLRSCIIENENASSTMESKESEDTIVLALPCISNTEWKAENKKVENKKAAKMKQNLSINTSISKFIESRAAQYITSSSPYFVRVMNYSNISGNGTMKIPIKFSELHLPNCRTKVTLKNLSGDCWMVNSVATIRKSSTMHTFCGGWLAFVRGNGLKIEDVCIFELVGECEMLVRILRLGVEGLENQTGNSSFDVSSIEMSGLALESAADVTQDTIGDQFLNDSEQFNDFYMYDFEEHKRNAEIVPAMQKSTVLYDTSDDSIVRKSPFMSAPSPLSRICDEFTDMFALCNAEETNLKETNKDNEVDLKAGNTIGDLAPVEEATAALTFTSSFPSFMKVMMNSNVGGSFTLAVPRSFSGAHLPSHKTNVILQNMEGRSWNVVSTRYGHQTKLCGGWMSFVRQNDVKVGDVCIFELIDEKVFQVRVFEGSHNDLEHQNNDVDDDSTL